MDASFKIVKIFPTRPLAQRGAVKPCHRILTMGKLRDGVTRGHRIATFFLSLKFGATRGKLRWDNGKRRILNLAHGATLHNCGPLLEFSKCYFLCGVARHWQLWCCFTMGTWNSRNFWSGYQIWVNLISMESLLNFPHEKKWKSCKFLMEQPS